ncbi:Maf family protein [Verrucomicrobiota bacterium sgz303538]
MSQFTLPSLILASSSPRRSDLLKEHGYQFHIVPADVEEISPAHLTPAEIVLENASRKARAIASKYPGELVLGVDTVVAFEGEVFGKPTDMEAAFAMIKRLNGRTHEVYSGVWFTHLAKQRENSFVEITKVHFHERTDEELRAYLARINPLDKAGSYAAQDDRGEMIARFEGSFTNVIGLPMERLEGVLNSLVRGET